MKILQICNKIPFPSKDGGSMAMHQMSDALQRLGHKVKILAMDTHKQNFQESSLDDAYRKRFNPDYVFIDTRIRILHAMVNLFSDKSYNIERFYSVAFEEKLKELLLHNKYDIIQLESIYVAPYLPVIRAFSQAKVVLRAHNIEHTIWERLAEGETRPLRKKYLRLLAERLKMYEQNNINKFDAIAAISPGDTAYFRSTGYTRPVIHIPFCVDVKPLEACAVKPHSLFFIGSMDWLPNEESVRWVLDHLWDKLLEKQPKLHFYIAGRHMPQWLITLNRKQVIVVPDVPDAHKFIGDKAILLAPYFSGGGMRVKFIEAMAQKKTVITTRIGAEGIEGRDGEHFLLAESMPGLLAAVDRCFREPELMDYIGANARSLVADKYDSRKNAEKLTELYRKLT
jgi:glycosyltransferase involved in cell wall biosynthesis